MEEKDVLTALREAFPGDVLETDMSLGDSGRPDPGPALPVVAAFLKAEPRAFTMLLDLTCVDFPDRPERFEMVYHLFSLAGIRGSGSRPAFRRNIRKSLRSRLSGRTPTGSSGRFSTCSGCVFPAIPTCAAC